MKNAKRPYKPHRINPPKLSYTEMLVMAHGETMGIVETAKALGVSRWTVYRQKDAGHFATTADGRRLQTRSVAAYIENQGAMRA
jgi:hypothetical protein